MERREFLERSAVWAAVGSLLLRRSAPAVSAPAPEIAVARDGEAAALARRAVDELGGMRKFVKPGDVVVVKPNIAWDRVPEQGATTNPDIVGEVVRMALEAGAKKVRVFDFTLNEPRRCYKRTGIEQAARQAGAEVTFVSERKFKSTAFPEGERIKSWEIYEDVLEADRLINVPAAKHHSVPDAGVSLGMKNLMGIIGGNRGQFHRDFAPKITDLNARIRPDLVILDAFRVLTRNGPSGGNLSDVSLRKTVIAGTDPVAVDAYGATLFNLKPDRIPFLVEARRRGLGENDLRRVSVRTVTLGA
jgi:uncharacterized protein (DUF362 family)